MPKREAIEIFSSVLDKVSRSGNRRKMEHIGDPTRYADIVGTWLRSKRFLNEAGYPRDLAFSGRYSFSSLVRIVSRRGDPAAILKVLIRYGNVRRTRSGKLRLVRTFFYTSGPQRMAYEPVAYFLSDASSTLSNILKRSKKQRGPDLFWHKTENARISDAAAKRFALFAKERSLLFLDEMDDWLEANSPQVRSGKGPKRRIGLGIFSIYSDKETFSKMR